MSVECIGNDCDTGMVNVPSSPLLKSASGLSLLLAVAVVPLGT